MNKIEMSYTDEFGNVTQVSWQSEKLGRDEIVHWLDEQALIGLGLKPYPRGDK